MPHEVIVTIAVELEAKGTLDLFGISHYPSITRTLSGIKCCLEMGFDQRRSRPPWVKEKFFHFFFLLLLVLFPLHPGPVALWLRRNKRVKNDNQAGSYARCPAARISLTLLPSRWCLYRSKEYVLTSPLRPLPVVRPS
jgi:hypothetical protein